MTRHLCAAALAISAIVSGTSHGATIINSWETDAEGWAGITTTTTAPGITQGTSAALRDMPTGWNNGMQSGYNAATRIGLQGETLLKVDVTPEFVVPDWAVFKITAQVILDGGVDQQLAAQSVLAGGTQTLTWDYSAISAGVNAATGWGHIRFITEVYGGFDVGNVTFDNLRAGIDAAPVPEPTAAGLLAMAAIGLARRGRRSVT